MIQIEEGTGLQTLGAQLKNGWLTLRFSVKQKFNPIVYRY